VSLARSTLSAAHAAGAENDISVRPLHTLAHDFAAAATRTRPAAARCTIDHSAVRAHHALASHDALRLLDQGRRFNRLRRETGVGLLAGNAMMARTAALAPKRMFLIMSMSLLGVGGA